MNIIKENSNCPGIYVIKNSINGKIYVGKSKNCYKRLHQHMTDIKIDNRNYNENLHLLNAVKKYGSDNFEYYLVEKFEENDPNLEKLLAERELYWMKELDSLNREKGYNLRWNSEGKCYCSDETREKIGNRAKKDWENGSHDNHSDKLKEYWKDNQKRKEQQSKLMSKNLTKWIYKVYNPDGKLIGDNLSYQELKELGLASGALSAFSKHKTNDVITKKHRVIRKIIKRLSKPLRNQRNNLK